MKTSEITLLILLLLFDAIDGQTNGLKEVFECGGLISEDDNGPPASPSKHRILLITPQEEYLYER